MSRPKPKKQKKPERIVLGVGYLWGAMSQRGGVRLTEDRNGLEPVPLRWTKALDTLRHRYRLVLERVEDE